MTRALIIIHSDFDRRRAAKWCEKAPDGCRVEFKQAKRSLPQNDLMWSRLTEVAAQATHNGRKYSADIWKSIFMAAMGREIQFVPSLDGKTFLPLSLSTSDLSKQEMNDLLTFMEVWASENGVKFRDTPPAPTAADYMRAG